MHHVLFILICCIWGSSFMLMKLGLATFGPLGVAGLRVTLGAAAVGVLWRMQRATWPMTRRDIGPLLFIALMGSIVPFSVQPYIIGVIEAHSGHGSSFAGLMVALVPLMTILASVPLLRTHPTPRQLLGVLGGLVAMGVLFSGELQTGVAPLDLGLASITPLCYAISNTYIKRRFPDTPTLALLFCTLGLSGLFLIPTGAALGTYDPAVAAFAAEASAEARRDTFYAIAAMLVLGVVATGIATFMFYKLVQNQGPLFASMVTYIIPSIAMIVGAIGGEHISAVQVGALLVILVMVALVQTARVRELPADEELFSEGPALQGAADRGDTGARPAGEPVPDYERE